MSSRDSWLQTILSHDIVEQDENNYALTRLRQDIANGTDPTLDQVLKIVCSTDAAEFSGIENEIARDVCQKIQSMSFMTTLSTGEFATFSAMLSAEEHELIATMRENIDRQDLCCSDSNIHILSLALASLGIEPSALESIKHFAAVVPFLKRTEVLLSIGGDDRLTINFNGNKQNKYLSSTIPKVGEIHRGSCTCSSTSMESYLLANRTRAEFVQEVLHRVLDMDPQLLRSSDAERANTVVSVIKGSFGAKQRLLHAKLLKVCGLSESSAQIVLFPSGSDAEFLPLMAALVRASFLLTAPMPDTGDVAAVEEWASKVRVINYVTAAGEVGR
jgi:hypothetical protein